MIIIKTLLDFSLPESLLNQVANGQEIRQRDKHIFNKNKKACGKILLTLISKWGNPKMNKKFPMICNLF